MRPIPKAERDRLGRKAFYHQCARRAILHDHWCQGNAITHRLIEWEHAITHAGPQSNEEAFIVPLCWGAHEGPDKCKEIAVWIAVNRASDELLQRYSKAINYLRKRETLNTKYGDPRKKLQELGGIPI